VSANIEGFAISCKFIFEKYFYPHFRQIISLLLSIVYFYTINIYDMELQGTIKKITDVQTFASGFQKREMVLLTEEQYPQPINIEFVQDKVDLLNSCTEGEKVKVSINIRGREWTSPQNEVKYFNSIVGWRLEKIADSTSFEPTQASGGTQAAPAPGKNVFEEEDDDLPF